MVELPFVGQKWHCPCVQNMTHCRSTWAGWVTNRAGQRDEGVCHCAWGLACNLQLVAPIESFLGNHASTPWYCLSAWATILPFLSLGAEINLVYLWPYMCSCWLLITEGNLLSSAHPFPLHPSSFTKSTSLYFKPIFGCFKSHLYHCMALTEKFNFWVSSLASDIYFTGSLCKRNVITYVIHSAQSTVNVNSPHPPSNCFPCSHLAQTFNVGDGLLHIKIRDNSPFKLMVNAFFKKVKQDLYWLTMVTKIEIRSTALGGQGSGGEDRNPIWFAYACSPESQKPVVYFQILSFPIFTRHLSNQHNHILEGNLPEVCHARNSLYI